MTSAARTDDDTGLLRFSILGPLQASCGGVVLPLGGAKQQMVLALLLLEANTAVTADRLIEWVWGESTRDRTLNTLQVYVANLRRILAAGAVPPGRRLITTVTSGYELRIEGDQLDTLQLDTLRKAGAQAKRDGQPEHSATAFRAALRLWRGTPLTGIPLGPAASALVAQLELGHITDLEQVAEGELDAGRHRECLGELRAWVHGYPLNEHLRSVFIIALYRCGRQAEALAEYHVGRDRLIEELGMEPSRELRELEVRILRQDPSLDLVMDRGTQHGAVVGPTLVRPSARARPALLERDGRMIPLGRRISTVGRLPDRDVVVDDAGVSRVHAEIRCSREGYCLVDGGSANGTSVNGARVAEQYLSDGDVIKVGDTVLIFRCQ